MCELPQTTRLFFSGSDEGKATPGFTGGQTLIPSLLVLVLLIREFIPEIVVEICAVAISTY